MSVCLLILLYVMSISFTYNEGVIIGDLVNFPITIFVIYLSVLLFIVVLMLFYIFKFVMIVKRIDTFSIYYARHKSLLLLILHNDVL